MESSKYVWYHENPGDQVWWVEAPLDRDGVWLFSFDRETVYNLFEDYPYKLTPEQKVIFDRENPYLAKYFSYRQ